MRFQGKLNSPSIGKLVIADKKNPSRHLEQWLPLSIPIKCKIGIMLYYAIHRPMQRIVGQCRTINNWARQLRCVTANFNKNYSTALCTNTKTKIKQNQPNLFCVKANCLSVLCSNTKYKYDYSCFAAICNLKYRCSLLASMPKGAMMHNYSVFNTASTL